MKIRSNIVSQEKENKVYAQLMKKWEPLHLTLDNYKSDKGQGDYQDQVKSAQDKESSSYQM